MYVIHNPLTDHLHATLINVGRLLQRDVPLPWHTEPLAAVSLLAGVIVLLWGGRLWKGILGLVGFTAGAIAGLCLRQVVVPGAEGLPALVYAVPSGMIGAMVFCFLDRVLGFALGSTLGLAFALPWCTQHLIHSSTGVYVATGAAFLFGGLMGLFFFPQFAILFTSTSGSLLASYGCYHLFLIRIDSLARQPDMLWGLSMALFLLLFMFGTCSLALSANTSGAGGDGGKPPAGKSPPPAHAKG